VLSGNVKPGDTIAIIGAGPVGMAALLTAQLYSPTYIIMVDNDAYRLKMAKTLGATHIINGKTENAIERLLEITNQVGVDVAIEAVGIPATFDMCQQVVAPGGHIANIGVHGKSIELHIEKLWIRNIVISMGLVNTNTISTLLKIIQSGKIKVDQLITHRFTLNEIIKAYDVFGNAAKEQALKVILSA
jgi:alcohol dehydrogenase